MNGLPCSNSFILPTSAEAPHGYCVMQYSEDLNGWSCISDHCDPTYGGDPNDPSLPSNPFNGMCCPVACRLLSEIKPVEGYYDTP